MNSDLIYRVDNSLESIERQLDLAWAAGFIDGDGCFAMNHHSSRSTHPSGRMLSLNVVQVDTRPLFRLKEMLGGNITRLGTTKKGSEIWQWRISDSAKLRDVIPLLLPYLFLKKREAELVFAFAHTVRPRGKVPNGVDPHPPELVAQRLRLIAEMDTIRGKSAAEVVMPG